MCRIVVVPNGTTFKIRSVSRDYKKHSGLQDTNLRKAKFTFLFQCIIVYMVL
jgi:hypothetical protein